MKFGIRKKINKIYFKYLEIYFNTRKLIFGFENANNLLRRIDKRAIIPILKKNGAHIGNDCDIESPLVIHNCNNYKNLIIGNNCHIGKNVFLDLKDEIVLKDNVTISMGSKIITHLDVGKSKLLRKYPKSQKKVIINKNCFVGTNSTILMGIELGENCFVAAGSVVKNFFPDNSFIAGIPAKLKKKIEVDK